MAELSRAAIDKKMAEVDLKDVDLGAVEDAAFAYISSNAVGSSLVGRAFSTRSREDHEEFAEWFGRMFEKIYRYREATKELEREQEEANANEDPE